MCAMAKQVTPEERRQLAVKAGISDAVLYQALNGYDPIKPAGCVAIETKLNRVLMRWDLRPNDWHEIWPEFIRRKGAPPVPTKQPA